MSEFEKIQDTLNLEDNDMKVLPSALNVLTILTYIGSALGLLGGIWNYFSSCSSAEKLANTEMPEMKGYLGDMMEQANIMAQLQCDNRLVLLIITVLSCVLCFIGAMMMRGFKKSGFMIYTVGEFLGPIAMTAVLGSIMMKGMNLGGIVIAVIFVILYATQLKHLKK